MKQGIGVYHGRTKVVWVTADVCNPCSVALCSQLVSLRFVIDIFIIVANKLLTS
jgi:hypothetical protein